jgi:hypothetical protein
VVYTQLELVLYRMQTYVPSLCGYRLSGWSLILWILRFANVHVTPPNIPYHTIELDLPLVSKNEHVFQMFNSVASVLA